MAKVINLFSRKTEGTPKETLPIPEIAAFGSSVVKNKENEEKLKKERAKKNQEVLRTYKIK